MKHTTARRLLVALFSLYGSLAWAEAKKPNVLVILADDMGYSDARCYGGEIDTPNLDRLAAGGLRFTQFYNTARCWPSRAALLTGYYAQQVRRDSLPGVRSGGSGVRPDWARLLPQYLKPLGYRSYHSGKWHVDGMPVANGFDRSYLLQDQDRYFSPRMHFEDDEKLPPVAPGSGYYATTAIADHAVKCLKEHASKHAGQPFFHYLAFTCPHFPLHALPGDVAKYRGRYREGWDALRQKRLARMKEAGIVTCELSPRDDKAVAWDSLSEPERDQWDARMAVHAAMIDRMDREIGRVLDQVRAMGAVDDTIVLFMSDNGASHERIVRGDGHDPSAAPGSARWYQCIEPGWANLANAPLRRSKIYVHEGGIATPLVVHWPHGIKARGELRHNPAHLIDLAPTVLELAGGRWPDSFDGKPAPPHPGKSLVPVFTADGAVDREYLWWCHSGNRAIRMGDWKLVSERDKPWELYNLAKDRSESHDLAAQQSDRVVQLEQAWKKRLDEFRDLATSSDKWEPAIRAFEAQDRASPPAQGGIVFVGSSSIRMWDLKISFPNLNAINRGFGGSQLADSVDYAERIVVPCRPKVVVLYAGDNDLKAGKKPKQIAGDYRRFVAQIHAALPDTRVVYIGVKPSLSRWNLIDQVRQTNALIRRQAGQNPLCVFVDVEKATLGSDGKPRADLFRSDGLHLNAAGYELWTKLVLPHLK